jgi:hypothetical protein
MCGASAPPSPFFKGEKMEKTHWNRYLVAAHLGGAAWATLLAALSPRICFAMFTMALYRSSIDVKPVMPGQIDMMFLYVGLALAPLLAFAGWRASELIAPMDRWGSDLPVPLIAGIVLAALSPLWGALLTVPFGVAGGAAAVVGYEVAMLAPAGFVLAVAAIATERRGEKPSVQLLTVVYHGGGFVGVYLAKRWFPGAKVMDDVTEKPPAGVVFLAFLALIAVLTKQL